ncbi:MAG TPA: hypothetical protein P5217_03970 [Methanoregulaceae archaeon]|nr:hypothetical protein [Methanoregulaceae archaeon]
MISTLLESGLILYDYFQVLVALSAVILAIHWKKTEFLAGLFFLFLYSIVETLDVIYFSFMHEISVDIAQFGFILLAIIFFIIGMNPAWIHRQPPCTSPSGAEKKIPGDQPLMTILKKI